MKFDAVVIKGEGFEITMFEEATHFIPKPTTMTAHSHSHQSMTGQFVTQK